MSCIWLARRRTPQGVSGSSRNVSAPGLTQLPASNSYCAHPTEEEKEVENRAKTSPASGTEIPKYRNTEYRDNNTRRLFAKDVVMVRTAKSEAADWETARTFARSHVIGGV
ncbi:hypothetical protein GX51_01435 [Blastomyces parvus]|uniref:Uncharacterized protein n=1 Tax=Blastomyces parvus TaxID=2060905 RepID=A0A2B7XGE8_9EURO|nr:hypothetical protein GX51_01435 [Blastomyces parvus]